MNRAHIAFCASISLAAALAVIIGGILISIVMPSALLAQPNAKPLPPASRRKDANHSDPSATPAGPNAPANANRPSSYPAEHESPWNGSWKLDLGRSSSIAKDGAAEGYRFQIGRDGRIRWEIPSLGEQADGQLGGSAFRVHRPTPTHGLALKVRADGPRTLLYEVTDNTGLQGGGRMVLIDSGKAWVDITWAHGHPAIGYRREVRGRRSARSTHVTSALAPQDPADRR